MRGVASGHSRVTFILILNTSMPSIQHSMHRLPLTALVVDDEDHSRRNLLSYLQTYCPEVEVVAEASSALAAKQLIEEQQPDALFLDIHMPHESGFDLLSDLANPDLLVVFVTGHDSYGVQAIKASAVDYLLKPVSIQELKRAVEKLLRLYYERNQGHTPLNEVYRESLAELAQALKSNALPKKIVLPTSEGLIVESLENLIRLEADSYCTAVVRKNSPNLLLSKTLKEFEGVLDPEHFVRVHHSHIINMSFLEKFDKRDGGYVVMADGSRVAVARRRHSLLIEKLKTFSWI